uniref:Uncharacterized protein n=1 Tax=Arundo donax TaxID=35708 RepID=A0A0A9EJ40_ARUDO
MALVKFDELRKWVFAYDITVKDKEWFTGSICKLVSC